jgi:hypothetical protein
MELELVVRFVAWEIRVTHEPQMGFEASIDQGLGKASNATGNTAGPGIAIGTFKSKKMKLRARAYRFFLWLHHSLAGAMLSNT